MNYDREVTSEIISQDDADNIGKNFYLNMALKI